MDCEYPNMKGNSAYAKGCRCGRCKEARSEYMKAYYAKHPDKWGREYATSNRGKASQALSRNRRHAEERGYAPIDATIDEVEALISRGCCDHCGATSNLNVDHCHDTGKLRGLLCSSCNNKDVLNGS